jgi:hypothetical protein
MKKSDDIRIAEIERNRDIAMEAIGLVRDNPIAAMVVGVAAVKGLEKLGLFSDTIANIMVGTIVSVEALQSVSQTVKTVGIGVAAAGGGALTAAAARKLLAGGATKVVAPSGFGGVSLLGAGLLLEPTKEYALRLRAGGGGELIQA